MTLLFHSTLSKYSCGYSHSEQNILCSLSVTTEYKDCLCIYTVICQTHVQLVPETAVLKTLSAFNQRRSNKRMGKSASGKASAIIRVIKSQGMRMTMA